MTLTSPTRDSKRRIVVSTKTQHKTMGQVATCFRSAATAFFEDVADQPAIELDGGERRISIDKEGEISISIDKDCEKGSSKKDWSDEGAWSDDEGAWSDEDTTFSNPNDCWESFNCTNIPYANEFVEQQISVASVRLANEKSEEIYLASAKVSRCESLKRVQFRPEPNLVTVISV